MTAKILEILRTLGHEPGPFRIRDGRILVSVFDRDADGEEASTALADIEEAMPDGVTVNFNGNTSTNGYDETLREVEITWTP